MPSKRKKKTQQDFPIIWIMLGGMIFIVLAAWGLSQPEPQAPIPPTLAATPTRAPTIRASATQSLAPSKAATPAAATATEDILSKVPRVSLADAKKAFDEKTAIFIDVRDANSFAESHIAGALSIPQAEVKDRLGELDPNAWIIPYCT